jgi:hypothetical protein
VTDFWWHNHCGYAARDGFYSDGRRKKIYAQHSIMESMLGRALLKGEVVDHINGDKRDNRRENLRIVEHFQNIQNQRRGKFRGTTWHKKIKKWSARVMFRYKNLYLGVFDDRYEAARVASEKRKELGFLEGADPASRGL